MRRLWILVFFVNLLFFLTSQPVAYGGLERVGPVSPDNGFPAWYQDKTGLTLEFCQPLNQAELDGGWCLLLPADTTVPEVFPTPFADEHFWWAGNAGIDFAGAGGANGRAVLVLGLEAAFSVGPVISGDQVTFTRIRFDVRNLPFSGTYTVYHPYGADVFSGQVAGGRLFFTEDIGITCPAGQFDCALQSRLGPFLLPANTPGGPELPPITGPVPGKLYIADPARLGPVTGSPLTTDFQTTGGPRNPNIFRIEGPNGFVIETTDFALMGRVYAGALAGKVTVDRASYIRTAASQQVDVYASAFPGTQTRLPASPTPAAVAPVLSFFEAPCGVDAVTGVPLAPVGATEIPMANAGHNFWGQSQPAAIPLAVCLKDATARDATGATVPAFFPANVTDEVTITQALYDPANGGSLTVSAASSDQVAPPVLTLGEFDAPLVNGQAVVTPLAAPPAKVHVLSSEGGFNEGQVTAGLAVPGATAPVALSDTVTINEDSGTANITVLANDTLGGLPITTGVVTITGAPRLGTAVANADGTIGYTPSLNLNGADSLAYTVTAGGTASNTTTVTINITPVNDPPVAVDDAASAILGTTAINVLANDTDVDGLADLANVVIVAQPLAGATVTGGATAVFSATAAGTYTFTYQAQDRVGALSANAATVTVIVAGAATDTVGVRLVEFRTDRLQWRLTGTATPSLNQTITVSLDDGTAPGTVIGTATVVAGAWTLDIRNASALDPRTTGATRIRATSSLGSAATASIVIRR